MKLIRTKIKKISVESNEDVYDITVRKNHNFFANNLLIHNCGEIPLCPDDSCRLIALNLYSYVNDPFTDKAKFDMDLFIKHAGYTQRIMDDIIDLEIEKIDSIIAKIDSDPEDESIKAIERNLWLNIKKKALDGRRTGIGITAEGDMLAALSIRYGSDESIQFCEEVHRTLATSVYKASCLLAQERGSFPVYDYNKELENPFIQRLINDEPELAGLLQKGRRNIALLTVAPTGTISMLTQTTSGIEPVFLPVYKRRRKINPTDVGKIKVPFGAIVNRAIFLRPFFNNSSNSLSFSQRRLINGLLISLL
jgi:ribonucleoside-diphosphate reductase alpha chain